MQQDFHYNVIRILAEKAGFKPEEAQIIAYASQYVDDATEFSPIKLPEGINFHFERLKDGEFDPICSAHKGLQFLGDFKKSVQMKIYFSYHFLPPEIYNGQEDYNYVTSPNSNFAKALMNKAIDNFDKKENSREYNLIALGIAIHTYADTWSHQGFSGRKSSEENNVQEIKIWKENQWQELSAVNRFRNRLLPEIGHAEAYHYPDLPYINWEYKKGEKGLKQVTRNNLDVFIDACENIYKYLSKVATNKTEDFSKFNSNLIKGLSFAENDYEERAKKFQSLFPHIGFYYDADDWKDEILKSDNEKFSTNNMIEERQSYKWLEFHKAALEQRNFITERVKPL